MKAVIWLYAFVFWPMGLVVAYAGYATVKLTPCFSPNVTIYQYCDHRFAVSANPVLVSAFISLGSIGWITVTHRILLKDSENKPGPETLPEE
jgi:hypothetical protein